ncbi:hypothetical protein [Paractinoplanes atraurantiacus]|uniref:Uncharacterized protein n=1 Tax=Paractinoplanes atraurantiacus TaxID=1036182 RepID=A0A285IP30_9ACTN|nr:hypothetical protein [Actinoplanes atraurantiacus]SNY49759.1 hypothetical protein SAMN05421748_110118 [Actinoplanes atraurantiacus]
MRIRSAFALAAGAAAVLAFSAPAQATVNIGNVDITVTDIASGNSYYLFQNVSVLQAAQICQVNVDVITATLLRGDSAKCSNKTNNHQQAWIKKH